MVLDFGDESSKPISIEVNKAFSTISNLGLPLLNIIPSFNKIVIIFENSEIRDQNKEKITLEMSCLLYTSPSPRDATLSRMPSSA